MNVHDLLKCVDQTRLTRDLWRLVSIPSPTCQERQAAMAFAEMLADAGAEVELDETLPESPNVIGRLRGNRPGKVLQLAGHVDHIDVAHAAPVLESAIISGRGSADMKNGLAGILEIIRVLKNMGTDFTGEVLVTVYGRHEAPNGDSQGLLNLIGAGIKGDAALVMEGPEDAAWIMAKGAAVWQVAVKRQGNSCHELKSDQNWDGFLGLILEVAEALRQENRRLQNQTQHYPLLGPESLFVGQLHYGDFYNRLTNQCRLEGTRRWHPHRTFDQAQKEFQSIFDDLIIPDPVAIEPHCSFVGESYEISADELVVQSLRRAHQTVTGKALAIDGTALVTDACRLVNEGAVPTILWGFDTRTAHGDYEFVELERVHRACQICLATVLDYLQAASHTHSTE